MQKSLLNMTLLLSWLLLAAASSTSMSREEGTDYSYTDEEETRASKDGVLKGLIHINSSTLQVLPTLMVGHFLQNSVLLTKKCFEKNIVFLNIAKNG